MLTEGDELAEPELEPELGLEPAPLVLLTTLVEPDDDDPLYAPVDGAVPVDGDAPLDALTTGLDTDPDEGAPGPR